MVEKRHGPDSIGHPGNLLLPFLEDRLSSEDRAMVQEHINACKECSHELQMLGEFMAKLKAKKDIFCPEPEQLFEFVQTGHDPEGKLARHIEHCPLCKEDVAAYRAGCDLAAMPEKVHAAYRERFSKLARKDADVAHKSLVERLNEWLSSLFKVPAFALATAVAAILVVVLIYPRGEIEPYIGLSSITWGQTDDEMVSKSSPFEAQRQKVAFLLVFKDFRQRLPQEKIDKLYEALEPTPEMHKRFDFVTPGQLKDAIGKEGIKSDDTEAVMERLRKDLDVSRIVFVDVISSKDRYLIQGKLADVTGGKIVQTETEEAVQNQLESKLRESVSALLTPQANKSNAPPSGEKD